MFITGEYQISAHVPERFRLDGGAMFGSVPKALWSKRIAADEVNRIQLVARVLVIQDASRVILVDAGLGRQWSDRDREIFAIEHVGAKALHDVVEGVTDIIISHLHFDHAAGVGCVSQNGESVLHFPEANVFVQKRNWEHAQTPGVRERASYLETTVQPLRSARLCLTEPGQEIYPGIRAFAADGHTHGLQWILVGNGKGAVAYPSDLIPTAHHISIPYVMGYDLWAEATMREKESFLQRAYEEEWIVVFEHDVDTCAATVAKDKKGRFCVGDSVSIPTYA